MKNVKRMASLLLAMIMVFGTVNTLLAEEVKMDYEVIIEPQFEAAGYFYEGLARVKKDGKWGYVDEDGNMVIPPSFDYAGNFYEGKAIVGISETPITDENLTIAVKMGYIDHRGNFTPFMILNNGTYGEWTVFDIDMLFEFHKDGFGYDINNLKNLGYNEGYFCIQYYDSYLIFAENGYEVDSYLGTYDFEGESYEMYLWGQFSDGLFMTTSPDWYPYAAFVDASGALKVQATSAYIDLIDDKYLLTSWYPFVEGYCLCWVTSPDPDVCGGRNCVALLDKNGKIVVTGNYDVATSTFRRFQELPRVLNDGRICLRDIDSQKFGAIDISGNVKIPFIYDQLSAFNEGLAYAVKDGKCGFVDVNGNVVIDFIYDDGTLFNGGIALVVKDGAPIVIDRYGNALDGSEKVPVDCYIGEDGVSYGVDEIIIIRENDKYGYARLTYKTALPKVDEMSAWAYPEVTEAIEKNLIPAYLQNSYFENITREDFAELIMKALEEVTGKDTESLLYERCGIEGIDIYNNNPFKDTNKKAVIAAHKLGIINGVSDVSFAPKNNISRQDAAALIMRAAKLIKGDIAVTESAFADNAAVADYAKQAVSYVTTLKIMNGVGENKFDPTATYTREQAYITILRLFKSLV